MVETKTETMKKVLKRIKENSTVFIIGNDVKQVDNPYLNNKKYNLDDLKNKLFKINKK